MFHELYGVTKILIMSDEVHVMETITMSGLMVVLRNNEELSVLNIKNATNYSIICRMKCSTCNLFKYVAVANRIFQYAQ